MMFFNEIFPENILSFPSVQNLIFLNLSKYSVGNILFVICLNPNFKPCLKER